MNVCERKIIHYLIDGDRKRAVMYAEHNLAKLERKIGSPKSVWDKYELMGARNIVHHLKGEPMEGEVVWQNEVETFSDGRSRRIRI